MANTFLDRLLIEEDDLNSKIFLLRAALEREGFKDKVGQFQFDLLTLQLGTMNTYSYILRTRIKNLSQSTSD